MCTYIPKMTCKVHVLCTIFLSATKLSFFFNSENVEREGGGKEEEEEEEEEE